MDNRAEVARKGRSYDNQQANDNSVTRVLTSFSSRNQRIDA